MAKVLKRHSSEAERITDIWFDCTDGLYSTRGTQILRELIADALADERERLLRQRHRTSQKAQEGSTR